MNRTDKGVSNIIYIIQCKNNVFRINANFTVCGRIVEIAVHSINLTG